MIKTKQELKQRDLKPVKHRGQNFLVSPEIIEKIIDSAKIKKGEIVLEVGPGTGNLTEALLKAGADVIAVEKDKNLAKLLKSKCQNLNVKVIEQDILGFDETQIKTAYRIIANIPYYLTGALIQKFLSSPNRPSEIMLMVQKEVGERITANPPQANYLSSLVQFLAEAEILFGVKKENFWPQPKVDSVVIKLTPHPFSTSLRSYAHAKSVEGEKCYYMDFLRVVFRQPRQTLFNNLRKSGLTNADKDKLEKLFNELGLDKKIRPQNLNQENLIKLFKSIT